ncbi:MAG: ATP-binding cassette domain-containing protein [Deltaproteobacteria bacterium]|nr:ATP-binding cassette domain-containing protein [Deltaproteobacteria bacterium]
MSNSSASNGDDILVEIKDLKKYFPVRRGIFIERHVGDVKAVDDISFTVRKGETLGLVGESGCGKTTIGRVITRLEKATAGEVRFEGRDILSIEGEELRQLRRDLQIVFQDPYSSLNPRMAAGNIVSFPLATHNLYPGSQRDKRVGELMELVGLTKEQAKWYPHEFAAGERQRIVLATALATNPKFIFCDEPVSALDVSAQAQVLNLLRDIKAQMDITIMVVAHNLCVVEYLSDRVVVMYLGKIMEMADTDDLYHRPLHPYTQALMSAVPTVEVGRSGSEIVLQGEIPSPMDPPRGCRFHTRCQAKIGEVCEVIEPKLVDVGNGHA